MVRTCEHCGTEFQAKRKDARFCTSAHRVAAHRAGVATKATTAAAKRVNAKTNDGRNDAAVAAAIASGFITETLTKELATAGRDDTVLGRLTQFLAMRVENGVTETGAGIAALVRELKATRAEALAGVDTTTDKVDELKERRARKLAGAGA